MQFRSLRGDLYTVKIYEEDWSGDVTTLTGAADPLVIEETDDKSLLTTWRVSTGYLRVVEMSYGDLDALKPESDTEHFVEVWVLPADAGANDTASLWWRGWMQSSEFSNEWRGGVRELEFPLMSPLCVLENTPIPQSFFLPLRTVTLGAALKAALTATGATWDYVYLPGGLTANGSSVNVARLENTIFTLALCGFNGNYRISGQTESMFGEEMWQMVVEGICNAFGWIAHEVGESLVFVHPTYEGAYVKIAFNSLDTASSSSTGVSGDDVVDFEDLWELSGDGHRESFEKPMRSVVMHFEGESSENASLSWDRTGKNENRGAQFWDTVQYGSNPEDYYVAAWLQNNFNEVTSQYMLSTPSLTSNGRMNANGVALANAGHGQSHDEIVLIQYDLDWVTNVNVPLVSLSIYNPPCEAVTVKMHWKWGYNLENLGNKEHEVTNVCWPHDIAEYDRMHDYILEHPHVTVELWVDGTYWKTQTGVQIDGDGYMIVYASLPLPGFESQYLYAHKLELRIFTPVTSEGGVAVYPGFVDNELLAIDQVSVQTFSHEFSSYSYKHTIREEVPGNSKGTGSGSVNMPFSFYRYNSRRIGTAIQQNLVNDYSYMFEKKKVLEVECSPMAAPVWSDYVKKVGISGGYFRVISRKRRPWDDEEEVSYEEVGE